MIDFTFQYSTKMIFGHGKQGEAGKMAASFGAKKALILYGGGSVIRSGLLGMITSSLDEAGIEHIELGGVVSNPRLELIREGIALCRREGINFVLACGGGSVIDSAKAIALGVPQNKDIWDVLSTFEQPETALPLGVVLTIPGTGSESGSGCVISNPDTNQKLLYGCEAIIPKFCIINPELFLSIPAKVYWPGICDMMSHVMERFFSPIEHTELSDRYCIATMRTLIDNALRLAEGENTYDVWAELSLAGNLAHNGICGLGRYPDWSCHFIEHEISAFYNVIHGHGLTVLTPAWMKYIYKDNIEIFAKFAVEIMGVEPKESVQDTAYEGITALENLFRRLGMPTTLGEIGINNRSLYETMAKQATVYGPIGYLKKLDVNDIVSVLMLAE